MRSIMLGLLLTVGACAPENGLELSFTRGSDKADGATLQAITLNPGQTLHLTLQCSEGPWDEDCAASVGIKVTNLRDFDPGREGSQKLLYGQMIVTNDPTVSSFSTSSLVVKRSSNGLGQCVVDEQHADLGCRDVGFLDGKGDAYASYEVWITRHETLDSNVPLRLAVGVVWD